VVLEVVFLRCAPHPALHFSRMRARFATHRCDDEDEAMAGDENVSMQRTVGGSSSTGGIKKGKRRRGKQKCAGHRQWLAARGADRPLAVGEASGS
jgi:hypothetical protein